MRQIVQKMVKMFRGRTVRKRFDIIPIKTKGITPWLILPLVLVLLQVLCSYFGITPRSHRRSQGQRVR